MRFVFGSEDNRKSPGVKVYLRAIQALIERYAKLYPIVGITGPRQSGKTTLAKSLFSHLPYVSLENLDIRSQAQTDPRAFLATYAKGAIFDEVQQAPELMSYLQQVVVKIPVKVVIFLPALRILRSANIFPNLSLVVLA